jgi:hypothetical protein
MKQSFIKKILSVKEWEEVAQDISDLFRSENEIHRHALGLKHDGDLIKSCFSHESLLMWNTHVWAHFGDGKWDAIFIGIIRKCEKFNKKSMDEYLWLSKKSNAGIKLYKEAVKFAKDQGCHHISMSVVNSHPLANKVISFYLREGFEKDSEVFLKKL